MTPDGGLLWTILKNRDNTLTQIAFLLGYPEAAPSNVGPGNRRSLLQAKSCHSAISGRIDDFVVSSDINKREFNFRTDALFPTHAKARP